MLDLIAERRAPFSPDSVVAEFAAALKAYRVGSVSGDRYAGEWPREAFMKHGVTYEPAERSKSDIYLAFLPLLNSGRVDLLDSAAAIRPARRPGAAHGARRARHLWITRPAVTTMWRTPWPALSSSPVAATGPMRITPEVMAQLHRNREMRGQLATAGVDPRTYRSPVFFR